MRYNSFKCIFSFKINQYLGSYYFTRSADDPVLGYLLCFRVYNDSKVRHSKTINFDVSCQMNFEKFPFDTQECNIKFESYGYSVDQLVMKWINEPLCQVKRHKAIKP